MNCTIENIFLLQIRNLRWQIICSRKPRNEPNMAGNRSSKGKDSKVRTCLLTVVKLNCSSNKCMSKQKHLPFKRSNCRFTDTPRTIQVNYTWWRMRRHITHQGLNNMNAHHAVLPEPKKVFFNLQLRAFFFTEEAPPRYSFQSSGWGRHSANGSLLNSACDASRNAISACCLCFIAGGTGREERGAMVKLSYGQLFCIHTIFRQNHRLIY